MTVKISSTPRPTIPSEHPNTRMFLTLFKENLRRIVVKKRRYDKHDADIRHFFSNEANDLEAMCHYLVSYVAEAFNHYAVWDYSHAYYPGRPSQQNARTDAIEGVSRVLPTLAAWLNSQGSDCGQLTGLDGKRIDVVTIVRKSFLAGTDPQHKGYWGTLQNYDQRICESADLALALWLSKAQVWDTYSLQEQQQIHRWFMQVNHCATVDNNWHLFPLLVQLVFKNLTGEDTIEHQRYQRIKEFYVGDGWFRDGANGNYDYYNAWGFFYSLYWIMQIDSTFDPVFIKQSLSEFADRYRYFFTPQGLPFFGRSLCYRLAAAVPLLAAADLQLNSVSLGQAKRAFKTNLHYFIRQGAMQNGAPTSGLFNNDFRLVDNYSGPASSFWSLRALNVALFCGNKSRLWQAEEQPLEIEKGSFELTLPAIDAEVYGTFETKEVTVIFKSEYTQEQTPLTRRLEIQTIKNRFLEVVGGYARRPKNNLLRKGITVYTSKMSHFF